MGEFLHFFSGTGERECMGVEPTLDRNATQQRF